MTPAQKLMVAAWRDETQRYQSLNWEAAQAFQRALARKVSGTAIYPTPVCSTAVRLDCAPIQVWEALVAAGVYAASPTPHEQFYGRLRAAS